MTNGVLDARALDTLLDQWLAAFAGIHRPPPSWTWQQKGHYMAEAGFRQVAGNVPPSPGRMVGIGLRLAGELSPEGLDWFEEAAEAVMAFDCFCLGGALAMIETGAMTDREFLHLDALLAGFALMRDGDIYQVYCQGRPDAPPRS